MVLRVKQTMATMVKRIHFLVLHFVSEGHHIENERGRHIKAPHRLHFIASLTLFQSVSQNQRGLFFASIRKSIERLAFTLQIKVPATRVYVR